MDVSFKEMEREGGEVGVCSVRARVEVQLSGRSRYECGRGRECERRGRREVREEERVEEGRWSRGRVVEGEEAEGEGVEGVVGVEGEGEGGEEERVLKYTLR
jgi:hypothetical protein